MIFVTTGTSLPFDRLVRAMEAVAPLFPEERFLVQIGNGSFIPTHMDWARSFGPQEYGQKVDECRLIVAHAGMGSLITALEAGKPIVILPRRLQFNEINTDHQLATAKRWAGRRGIFVAMDETELVDAVTKALTAHGPEMSLGPANSLVDKLNSFIENQ